MPVPLVCEDRRNIFFKPLKPKQQWLQVRTEAFKNWFGDWINDPANASKVVDENGEPLVVYRNTEKRFNVERKYTFFADNREYADDLGRPDGRFAGEAPDTHFVLDIFQFSFAWLAS